VTWPSATLDELCEINIGRTPARANPAYWGEGQPWLSIADMKQGREITRTKEQITDAGAAGGRQVTPGTVLLSFKLSIGKIAKAAIPLFTNEAIAALPIKREELITEDFLMRALERADLSGNSNRAAMGATLNKAKLKEVRIPIPPLREQRRIAAILDHADALRAKRRQTVTNLDSLTQSFFHAMFAEVAASATVEEIASSAKGSIRTGPFGSQLLHSEFVDDGIAVLGLDNVVGNEFRWAGRRFITPGKYEQLARYTVHPGDVLISIMGTTGRCVVVPDDIPRAINTKHICAITPDHARVEPVFLRGAFLWHPESRAHLQRQTKGSIMDGLNMGIVKSMPVPVPPLRLQKEFRERMRAVDGLRSSAMQGAAADDSLFASLQSHAFRGDL
jgi:type I restriction enzyme S subunit